MSNREHIEAFYCACYDQESLSISVPTPEPCSLCRSPFVTDTISQVSTNATAPKPVTVAENMTVFRAGIVTLRLSLSHVLLMVTISNGYSLMITKSLSNVDTMLLVLI